MERLAIPNLHRLASSNIIIDKEEVEKIVMNVVFAINAGSYRVEHCNKMGHFYCGDCVQQYVHTTIHNGKYPDIVQHVLQKTNTTRRRTMRKKEKMKKIIMLMMTESLKKHITSLHQRL